MKNITNISVIVLSKNNANDVSFTLDSIRIQSVTPSRIILADGSEEPDKTSIFRLAECQREEYFWIAPKGIYDAMRIALAKLDDSDYVVFLNSGDSFYDHSALANLLAAAYERDGSGSSWVLGGIIISDKGIEIDRYVPPPPRDTEDFCGMLRGRKLWLPHPSTMYRVEALRSVGPFAGNLRIAADLQTGIRMAKKFGQPAITGQIISNFALGGVSTTSPVRLAVESFAVRVREFGFAVALIESTELVKQLLRVMKKRCATFLKLARRV